MGIDAMTLYRMGRKLYLRGIPVLPAVVRKVIHYVHGSYIPCEADIGEGTLISTPADKPATPATPKTR